MGCARGCVCLCAHAARAGRVPLPLTKLQWSSVGGHRAPPHVPSPGLRGRPIPAPAPAPLRSPAAPHSPNSPPTAGDEGHWVREGQRCPWGSSVLSPGTCLGVSPNLRLRRRRRRPEIAGDAFRDPEQELSIMGSTPGFNSIFSVLRSTNN